MKKFLVLLGVFGLVSVLASVAIAYIIIAGIIRFATLTPQTDRNWASDQAYAARVTLGTDGLATIDQVRDWTYATTGPQTREWVSMTVAPSTITDTWLYIDRFSRVPGIAHAFLVFDFADGQTLALSVEARRESDETYSPVAGVFRRFELIYLWTTERDIVARRTVFQNSAVFRYRLALPPALATAVLQGAFERTNAVVDSPVFYNTLTDNCMGLLAELVNAAAPGTLPWDPSWLAPGFADVTLLRLGLIGTPGEGVGALRARAALSPYREAIAEKANEDAAAFSAWLRTLLEAKP